MRGGGGGGLNLEKHQDSPPSRVYHRSRDLDSWNTAQMLELKQGSRAEKACVSKALTPF